MKELRGSATGVTTAPVDDCVRFCLAVDRYPTWYPEVVRTVEVVNRDADGEPTRARAVLHVAVGPIVKDFDLALAITLAEPRTVKLTRVPNHAGDDERFDVTWRLEEDASSTHIRLDVAASLSVPRFLPVGGIGDGLAAGFVSAATRALDA
jgi:Polyketide cyclase / dehydrase and lipid transport